MNVGNPDRAFDFANIPNCGVGLARLEFIINRMIGVHPQALLDYDNLDAATREAVDQQMAGYSDPVGFFVERLTEGISVIAAAFAPEPVIVRMSDFKSNEYANLVGGERYEPDEENPMLGPICHTTPEGRGSEGQPSTGRQGQLSADRSIFLSAERGEM